MNFLENRELRELEKDRIKNQSEINIFKVSFEKSLKGDLGEDIKDVINGRKVVELSFREKLKYKINNFFNKIFRAL